MSLNFPSVDDGQTLLLMFLVGLCQCDLPHFRYCSVKVALEQFDLRWRRLQGIHDL